MYYIDEIPASQSIEYVLLVIQIKHGQIDVTILPCIDELTSID